MRITFQLTARFRERAGKVRFYLLSVDAAQRAVRQLFNGDRFIFPKKAEEQDDSTYVEDDFAFHFGLYRLPCAAGSRGPRG
jgi:hypothetical protein